MSEQAESSGVEAALAAPALDWLSESAARELAAYLLEHEPDQIRADLNQSAVHLARIRERLLLLVEPPPAAPPDEARLAEFERTVSNLQQQLDERAAQFEKANLDHAAERVRLIEERQAADGRIAELEAELSEARQAVDRLQAKSDSFAAALVDRGPAPVELADEIAEAEAQFTIAGVIEMSRDRCQRVVMPDASLREIDTLDVDEKAADWARELWKALRALNAYAEESEFFQGGFWEWCEHSNSEHNLWPATPKKLAMSESDTVKNDSRLWRMRRFLVDAKVSPNGYQHMEAHLKIAEGGGQHIPRLYFHDDVKGRTGQIHIGFLGPHRLVQTSQS
ncbi:MAG: hypothetical protein OXH38_05960 [Chloroflexi bacterium]|nr:hypothetical protein [Chloroflexota bacterium]